MMVKRTECKQKEKRHCSYSGTKILTTSLCLWIFNERIECYEHRDGSISKTNGNIDEKVNSIESSNEYIEENGVHSVSTAIKVVHFNDIGRF